MVGMTEHSVSFVRTYHAFGGIKVVVTYPSRDAEMDPEQDLSPDSDFPFALGGFLGAELATSRAEQDGLIPREWMVCEMQPDGRTPWVSKQLKELLQKLGAAARERGHLAFDLACWQLKFHLNICAVKVREISDAYHGQLSYLLSRPHSDWKTGRWITAVHTQEIQQAVYSFLQEGAILRDVVARIISRFQPSICTADCSSMAQLIKKWSYASADDQRLSEVRSLVEEANHNWMKELGSFRNCYVHDVPLHHRFASTACCEINRIRHLRHYLPDDPECWRKDYSLDRCATHGDLTDELVAQMYDRHKEHLSQKRDALHYSHTVMLCFYNLVARLLPLISPVEPLLELSPVTPIEGTLKTWIE